MVEYVSGFVGEGRRSNRPIETDLRKRASPACSAAHGRRYAA